MSVYREKPKRVFTANPMAFPGARIPAYCYDELSDRINWPRAFQWVCPELTDDEAVICVAKARSRMMMFTVATVLTLAKEL